MQITKRPNKYELTTVNCTYSYTHSGKIGKYEIYKYEICTASICVIPISVKSYAFCVTLPLVSEVTSMPALLSGAVQSVLLTPTR